MSIITLPATLPIGAGSGLGQRRFDTTAFSDSTGSQQSRLLGPPLWSLRLMQPDYLDQVEAGEWTALAMQLRGRVNVLAAFNPGLPAPRGTLRGALTLSAAAAAGATSISVTGGAGQAGKTLLPGDLLGIGSGLGTSQVVMVVAAATANGSGVASVSIEPPLRAAHAGGVAVAWDKPVCYYRQQADSTSWAYKAGGLAITGFALELLETLG